MGLRDHRQKAEGKKPKGRRMPKTTEASLGTRVHESCRPEDEEVPEVVNCDECGELVEEIELEFFDDKYICFDCATDLEEGELNEVSDV